MAEPPIPITWRCLASVMTALRAQEFPARLLLGRTDAHLRLEATSAWDGPCGRMELQKRWERREAREFAGKRHELSGCPRQARRTPENLRAQYRARLQIFLP